MSFVRMVTREKLNNTQDVLGSGNLYFIKGSEYRMRLNDLGKSFKDCQFIRVNDELVEVTHNMLHDTIYHHEFIEEYEK